MPAFHPIADILLTGHASLMRVPPDLWIVVLALGLAGCSEGGQQPQKHFEAALLNTSTAPSLVRIELLAGGKSRTICVYAEDLITAVMAEHRLQGQQGFEQAVSTAKSNERHRFIFKRAEALEALNLGSDEPERQQGCVIIARGRPAFRDDLSGEIREGPPSDDV
jgi:hypothetical protein